MISNSMIRNVYFREALYISIAIVGMALCSQVAIPFYPVPLTMQTFGIKAIALFLPPRHAFLSVLAWLTLGVMGVPFFAFLSAGPGVMCGPTGGYLWGMLLTAPIMSFCWHSSYFQKGMIYLGFHSVKSNIIMSFLIGLLGGALTLAMGWAQLAFILGDGQKAFSLGVFPFILGDIIKTLMFISVVYYGSKR